MNTLKMEFSIKFLLYISVLFTYVNSANILAIFHTPSKSHHIQGSSLLKELARRGHNVTMVSPFPLKKRIANYTDIALTKFTENYEEFLHTINEEQSLLEILAGVLNLFISMTVHALHDKSFQDFLKTNSKFDVVITFTLMTEAMVAVGHHFKAPVVGFSPIGSNPMTNYYTGNIAPPAFVPNAFLPFSEEMTFFQRVSNTLAALIFTMYYRFVTIPIQEKEVKRVFPNAPSLTELLKNVNLHLLNSHYSLEGHRPHMTNMIQIGGFYLQEKEEVPKDIKKFLDDAKEGVVYFSLGTNIQSTQLGKQKIKAIKSAFAKLSLKVLWKFDIDLPDVSKNVKIESWLPQKSILAHPNVKLFITHGGHGGITEAYYCGVPMVAIPIFGDQKNNVADCKRRGACIELNFKTFGEEEFWNGIQEVLNNPKYTQNAEKLSSLIHDQPINPMEHAVYWVEHVIRHKNTDHLNTIAARLPFYKLYLLDVIGLFIAIIIIAVFIGGYFVKVLLRYFCGVKLFPKIKRN